MTDKPEGPVVPTKVLDGLRTIIENAVQAERARWFAAGYVPLSVREGRQTPEQWAQATNDLIKGLQEQRTALANDVEKLSRAIVEAEWAGFRWDAGGGNDKCPFCDVDREDSDHKPDCVVRSARDNLRGYSVVGTTTGITISQEKVDAVLEREGITAEEAVRRMEKAGYGSIVAYDPDEVLAEREACAKVAEGGSFLHDDSPAARFGRECAAAIRRRGEPKDGDQS